MALGPCSRRGERPPVQGARDMAGGGLRRPQELGRYPIALPRLRLLGQLIDSDSLYWVFHMKENFLIKC